MMNGFYDFVSSSKTMMRSQIISSDFQFGSSSLYGISDGGSVNFPCMLIHAFKHLLKPYIGSRSWSWCNPRRWRYNKRKCTSRLPIDTRRDCRIKCFYKMHLWNIKPWQKVGYIQLTEARDYGVFQDLSDGNQY